MKFGSIIRHVVAAAAAGLLALAAAAPASALTVYTAVEAEDLKKYAARFNEDHPDIEIKWVRDSTGIVTAKLLAEKNNPKADVIWGLAATSLLLMKSEGMLDPYKPKGVERLDPRFRRQGRSSGVDRHGCVGGIGLREHGGAEQARIRDPGVVEGSHQARVQGPCRNAEPELVRHRLPRRLELAADLR